MNKENGVFVKRLIFWLWINYYYWKWHWHQHHPTMKETNSKANLSMEACWQGTDDSPPHRVHSRLDTATNSPATPINSLWNKFKLECMKTLNTYVPSKMTSSRHSQPWCNRIIRRLTRRKRRPTRRPGPVFIKHLKSNVYVTLNAISSWLIQIFIT